MDYRAEAERLIAEHLAEINANRYYDAKTKDYEVGRAILESDLLLQAAVLLALTKIDDRTTQYRLQGLRYQLVSRSLPLSAAELGQLLSSSVKIGHLYGQWGVVLKKLRRFSDENSGLTPVMRGSVEAMSAQFIPNDYTELRNLRFSIDTLLGKSLAELPDPGESWADAARAEAGASAAWVAVFTHAATANGGKPNAKWLAEAEKNRRVVGEDEFRQRVSGWLLLARVPPLPAPRGQTMAGDGFVVHDTAGLVRVSEKNNAILKGLGWYCSLSNGVELARALDHMAEAAFGNIPEHGAWAKGAGNAALWALGQMPGGVGVAPLARLRTRLRDRSALKLIAASIEAAAKAAGMTVDELEDLAVPTGGLGADGTRREVFGEDGSAVLTLDAKNAKTNLQWFGPDGKPRKAVPAAVKANHAAEVKALKAAEEEIRGALSAQAARFDKFLLDEREWPYVQWKERYLAHPILGNLARRLIWTVDGVPFLPSSPSEPSPIPMGEGRVGASPGGPVVKLWHPLGATPEDVLQWRQRLEAQEIVQPFKQAHREIYLLTDAERNTRTYSNRFAAHIIKQHQFNSLCVLRGWKNTLRLMVDDSYPPATRELPRHNLRAEFWVEGIGDDYGTDTNETGTYLRLATDQVRFYALDAGTNSAHASGGGYTAGWRQNPAEPLPLDQVPALAFSEVMRDMDLFVGVASVGNDPTWADGGPQGRYIAYWQDYAFGDLSETARTRADVLARLLPRLKIAGRCRLDGKFLVVRGDLRTYKIHLGSGNILMEPNDQYLCIVPGSRGDDGDDLFLPFAGDRVLAVVLSKAFLLAADTQIADTTIMRQIGANRVN